MVEWEIFEKVWGRLCGRYMVLRKVQVNRAALKEQVGARLQFQIVAKEREDALEAMKREVFSKNLRLKSAQEALRNQRESLAKQTKSVVPSFRSLQCALNAAAGARRRLQGAELLLSGDGGRERLQKLCDLLDTRKRRMVAEIVSIYPLVSSKPDIPSTREVERIAVDRDGSSLVIAGMALSEPGKKLSGLARDKIENDMSATALGYVGHVVTLVARYFDIQLRYPIVEMASRSFIRDNSPAVEPPAVDAVTAAVAPHYGAQRLAVEFPLFSESQDSTRSAYAVFLLNKDLEQILNHLGFESVGPRHTLLNLEKFVKVVLSRKHPLA